MFALKPYLLKAEKHNTLIEGVKDKGLASRLISMDDYLCNGSQRVIKLNKSRLRDSIEPLYMHM